MLNDPSVLVHASSTAIRLLYNGTFEFQKVALVHTNAKILMSLGHCVFLLTFQA
jgi:hypothetical protein